MSEKVKNDSDKKLIQKIFGVEPQDWARYQNGDLIFISPTGQKFSYTEDFLQEQLKEQKEVVAFKEKLEQKEGIVAHPSGDERASVPASANGHGKPKTKTK